MTFSANNLVTNDYEYLDKRIDENTSTCSNLVYNPEYNRAETDVAGYTYDATTKVLTFIYDYAGTNDYASNLSTDHYIVTEISSTKLVFSQKYEYTDDRTGARDNAVRIDYTEFLKR